MMNDRPHFSAPIFPTDALHSGWSKRNVPSLGVPYQLMTLGAVSLLLWILGVSTGYAQPSAQPSPSSTSDSIEPSLHPPESPESPESSESPESPESSATASTEEFCSIQNSRQQDEAIILGDIPDAPYVVVIPGAGSDLLDAVRQCVPDAFQTHSRLGRYIRAGAFFNRSSAEQLSRHLRSIQLDARVVYLP